MSIDKLVAEKVMGWRPHPDGPAWWQDSEGATQSKISTWSPSTNHNDAWEMVEAMKARGFRLKLEDFGNIYRANFKSETTCFAFNESEHASAHTAICMAALCAVGVTWDEIDKAMEAKA